MSCTYDISVANLYHILACFCSFTTFLFQKFATLSCVSVDFQHNALILHDIDTFGDQALHSAMFWVSIVIGIDALSRFLLIVCGISGMQQKTDFDLSLKYFCGQ